MATNDNDLTAAKKEMGSNLSVVATVYEDEQRARKGKAKIVYEEEDEDSNKNIHFLKKFASRRYRNFENRNGASSSSSASRLRIRWSGPCSSPLLLDHKTSESEKTDPNSQSLCLTDTTSLKSRDDGVKTAPLQRNARVMAWWLVPLVRDMNGKHPMLIFEKTLFGSDVKPTQSRFSMPFKKLMRKGFLRPVELRILKQDINNGVGAILVDPRSVKWGVVLKIWGFKNDSGNGSWTFSLTCGWNDVVEANELKEGDNIGVWSFRCRGILCFALVPLPPAMGLRSSSFLP